ncbi:unnamed protein product [Vitrella brassicaformis CCMP3155]|uniref:Transmembrane protein n=1 Tax=Vitrella brassicaformis (strain CCMP3155) TaxID=1169540 RepID=A0A0G4FEI1_VITBC|nr:unnamed protein product [Vitrella brassicaformis CCMP3155]|eukprot:CEM11597.1 unnamed protein product [Vitrella brassicaformis CCMP3155]
MSAWCCSLLRIRWPPFAQDANRTPSEQSRIKRGAQHEVFLQRSFVIVWTFALFFLVMFVAAHVFLQSYVGPAFFEFFLGTSILSTGLWAVYRRRTRELQLFIASGFFNVLLLTLWVTRVSLPYVVGHHFIPTGDTPTFTAEGDGGNSTHSLPEEPSHTAEWYKVLTFGVVASILSSAAQLLLIPIAYYLMRRAVSCPYPPDLVLSAVDTSLTTTLNVSRDPLDEWEAGALSSENPLPPRDASRWSISVSVANTAVSRECEDFIATYEKSIDQIVASGHLPRCQDRVEAVTAARSGLLYRWQKPQIKPSRAYTPPSPSPTPPPPPQPQPPQVPADTLEDGKQPSPPSAAPSERDSERVVPRIPSIPSGGITSFASMSTLSCLSEHGTTTHKAACQEPGGYPIARDAVRDKTAGSVADKCPHPHPQAQPHPQTPSPPSALSSAVRATISTPRMATGCAAARHTHTKSLTDLRLPVVERHHSLSSSAPCTSLLGSADDTPPPLLFATPQKGVGAASDAGNRGRGSTATQQVGG